MLDGFTSCREKDGESRRNIQYRFYLDHEILSYHDHSVGSSTIFARFYKGRYNGSTRRLCSLMIHNGALTMLRQTANRGKGNQVLVESNPLEIKL